MVLKYIEGIERWLVMSKEKLKIEDIFKDGLLVGVMRWVGYNNAKDAK